MDYQEMIEQAIVGYKPSDLGWYRVECCFCLANTGKRDKKGSLAVSATTGKYQCWKCGEEGRVHLEFNGELPDARPEIVTMDPPEGYEPLWKDPGLTSPLLAPARRYLVKRLGRVARTICKEANIGASLAGPHAGRIIVPVMNENRSEWAGWVGRDYTGKSRLKYKTAPGMRRILFNCSVLKEKHPFVLVVEGVFDALPHWPNVVACLGKPDRKQKAVLREAAPPLVIALDGDAWQEGSGLAKALRFAGKEVGCVRLPPAEDPGSIDKNWLYQQALNSLNSHTPVGYTD